MATIEEVLQERALEDCFRCSLGLLEPGEGKSARETREKEKQEQKQKQKQSIDRLFVGARGVAHVLLELGRSLEPRRRSISKVDTSH